LGTDNDTSDIKKFTLADLVRFSNTVDVEKSNITFDGLKMNKEMA
jgi:L-cysteine desulfidase